VRLERDLQALALAIDSSGAPDGVLTKIVGIDGHGGAGKSTVAARLADELDAQVVHTDDFASWADPVNWWPRLRDQVLVPLAAGEAATFQPTQWDDTKPDPVIVQPGHLVVVEGVTAIRSAFRRFLALKIWVETPCDLCLHRGLARDGEQAREQWEQWLAAEDEYIARERPQAYADIVFDGRNGL
jgi:uridine kinase